MVEKQYLIFEVSEAAERIRSQIRRVGHGSAKGDRRRALAAVDLPDLDAGDPVVGQWRGTRTAFERWWC